MKKNRLILIFAFLAIVEGRLAAQSLHLQENAAIYIQEGAAIEAGGDIVNNGFIENLGAISVYGDFINNSILNSTEGLLQFLGNGDQMILSRTLDLRALTVDGANDVTLTGDSVLISEELNFFNGILRTTDTTELILLEDAIASEGNDGSYFEGGLIQLGNGDKLFPIGNNGAYTPITLQDIRGINVRLRVSAIVPHLPIPEPSDEVIGVSEHALWLVQSEGGFFDSAQVAIDFFNADLENFTNENEINADFISPVVVEKDSIDGQFVTLGVSSLLDTDSLTFGSVVAESYIDLSATGEKFLAVGRAPIASTEGLVYIPNVFSPNAIEEENKTFRIFGTRIVNQDFQLRVFNQNNVLVYQTDDFVEANQFGWNGTNQNNGNEEPNGLYYYTITYRLEGGEINSDQGAIYLIR